MRKNIMELIGLLLSLIVFLVPSPAYADAGTLLMWLGIYHLFVGNAIIGVIEGIIISRVFKVKFLRSIPIMILANYASMIAGAVAIGLGASGLSNSVSINNISFVVLLFLIGSYIFTIIAEWPFCFWILKGKDKRRAVSFRASVIVQSVSYVILIPLYFLASGTTLATGVKVDKPAAFLKTNNAWIYFILPSDHSLYRIRPDGSLKQMMIKSAAPGKYFRLFICEKDKKTVLKLNWDVRKGNRYEEESKILLDDLRGVVASKEDCNAEVEWFRRYGTADFRAADKRDWDVRTGFWAIEGLNAKNKKTGAKLWLSLETPFFMWQVSRATVLPEDQVVCQIGEQIVLVDLNTRKIGLITFGVSPVVVLEK